MLFLAAQADVVRLWGKCIDWEAVREEMASNENQALKRRIEEVLEENGASRKRHAAMAVERAQVTAERDVYRAQTESLKRDAETLRASYSELESKTAVLQAAAKLETCRRSLGSSGRVV